MSNLDPLTNGSYWGPIGPPEVVLVERILFTNGYVNSSFTTAQFIFYLICMRILWFSLSDDGRRSSKYFLMAYSTVLCSTSLIVWAISNQSDFDAFINHVNFPGGPVAYVQAATGLAINIAGLTILVIGNILADLLLLYRCLTIWGAVAGYHFTSISSFPVVAIPVTLAAASFGMGITFDILSTNPGGNLAETAAHIGLAYFTLSLTLNLTLSGMIVYRIWSHQRSTRIISDSSKNTHVHSLTFVAVMFAESAALYTISLIPLLVTFGLNSPYSQYFLGISANVQMVCSYNIIWRVGQNRAWSRDTTIGSEIVFASNRSPQRSTNYHLPGDQKELKLGELESGDRVTTMTANSETGSRR